MWIALSLVLACSKDSALLRVPWSSDQNAILIVTDHAGVPIENVVSVMLSDADFSSFRVEHEGRVRVFALVFPKSEAGGPRLEDCVVEFGGDGGLLGEPEQVWASEVFESAEAGAIELNLETAQPAFGLRLNHCPEDQGCETPGVAPLSLLRFGAEQPLKRKMAALLPRTATTALAIGTADAEARAVFYEVTLNGPRFLPLEIPGLTVTAAYQSDDALDRRVFVAGRRGGSAELYAITSTFGVARFPTLPPDFAGGPSSIALPLAPGADADAIYLLAEDGAIWRLSNNVWFNVASLNKTRDTLGLLAWNRPEELYFTSPDAEELFRFESGSIAGDTTTPVFFDDDHITMLTSVPPLGIVLGTFKDVVLVHEREQWTIKESSLSVHRAIRTIIRYHGGYLIGGGHGYIFHYNSKLEKCDDDVTVGIASVVHGVVELEGGLVALVEHGEGPLFILVLR